VVRVPVDLDVATNAEFGWGDEFVVLVHVLVLLAAQEGPFNNATVLNSRLVNRDAIVRQIERDDETAVDVFRNARVKASVVAQNLLIVVDRLEKVTFWFFRNQIVDVAEGIYFGSETVIRRNLALSWFRGLRLLHS